VVKLNYHNPSTTHLRKELYLHDNIHKQLSLADIFSDRQDKFDNDKYHFLSPLDETINLDEIVPPSFGSHFHALTGRPRTHKLYPILKALLLQRIFFISTDAFLIIFLKYSQEFSLLLKLSTNSTAVPLKKVKVIHSLVENRFAIS